MKRRSEFQRGAPSPPGPSRGGSGVPPPAGVPSPPSPANLRDEIIGLGSRSLRKSYFGKLQRQVADLERFRALLDVASDAIVVAELPGFLVVDSNEAGRALLGVAPQDPVGRPLASFFPRRVWRRLHRVLEGGAATPGGRAPTLVRTGGRGGRELEILAREEAFGGARYVVAVARDVTERRRAVRALAEAKLAAERVARARTEFMSIASHELRTPLTALQLRAEAASRAPETAALAGRLLGPLRRLGAIVDDLLAASRLEDGAVRLHRVRVDLRAVAARILDEFQPVAGDRPLRLADGPAVIAPVDPARAGQILANVLDNAVKYSPPRSPIDVRVRAEGGSAHVSVADHGPGIPAAERAQLFTPFARLPGTRTIPGLGLGLHIARQLARMHRGAIALSDTPGGGATFTVSFPLSVDAPDQPAPPR